MTLELMKVVQRVRVPKLDERGNPKFDEHGNLSLKKLGSGVFAVLEELCLAAERDREFEPLRISASQLARRAGRDEVEAKSIRKARKEAILLGLIKREPRTGELGAHAPDPVWIHEALIQAALRPRPWEGPPIVFPRDWDERDPGQLPKRFVTWGVETTAPVETATRKGKEKNHYPPSSGRDPPSSCPKPRRAEPAGEPGPAEAAPVQTSSGSCGRPRGGLPPGGGSGIRTQLPPNQECPERFAKPEESIAALSRWLDGGRRRTQQLAAQVPPLAPELENELVEFCDWLEASAAAAGWVAKQEGAWSGAVAGDLAFALQRRSAGSGKRRGTFIRGKSEPRYHRVSLGKVAAGAKSELDDAAVAQAEEAAAEAKAAANGSKRADSIEAIFWPLGDHALLLVDDLDEAALEQFAGWSGVAIIETSPGNYQAMMMAPRVLRGHELRAAQSALCRRAGLPLEAVQANQPRRFPGSVNRKPELEGKPFVTRLVGKPRVGTISVEELAALLAEDAAAKAADAASPVSTPRREQTTRQEADQQSVRHRAREATDQSDSGKDWAWGMKRFHQFPPPSPAIVVEELVALVAARGGRQGKPADHPDHRRYAELTVMKLHREIQARRSR